MPKYVIHVGPSKTGTTYLQGSLRFTRGALLEHGISYPLNWFQRRRTLNHEFLFNEIRQPQGTRLRDALAELNRSDLKTVVLSFEGFPILKKEELIRFREMLEKSEINIVYYFRRWCERIPSGWQQWVKGGGTRDFPDTVVRLMTHAQRSPGINYGVQLDKFSDVFGRDSLRLLSYNNVLQTKQDLFRHFCANVLDVDYVGELPSTNKNESFNIYDTEIFRVLNVFEEQEAEKTSVNRMRRFLALRNTMDLTWLKDRMKEHVGDVRLSDRGPLLDAIYDDLTTRYLDKLVDPVKDAGLFRRKARTAQYVRSDYLLTKGTSDVIRDMHERIRAA